MINVKSEIMPLKRVLLHRPGNELLNLTPDSLQRLLFDDIPYLQRAREEHDEFAVGLVSEFTNVISGHAVTAIKDYFLDISPPYTIIGHNHIIAWPKNYPVIAIPFTTPYGPFEVDVCFK